MCDGDKSLVVIDDILLKVAERNMQDVLPLFYNMYKAPDHHISLKAIYKGMEAAWSGSNIGLISNDITKVWNSDNNKSQEALDVVKLLCAENNFQIDYAKTLYKPERPKHINAIINKYTNAKVPHFFINAKDYEEEDVEEIGKGFVDYLDGLFKKPRKKKNNLGKLDYRILMSNPDIKVDDKVIEIYNSLKHFAPLQFNGYGWGLLGNVPFVYELAKTKLFESGFTDVEITDMLIKYLYDVKKTRYKTFLWLYYGDIILANLKQQSFINDTIYCSECGRRQIKTYNTKQVCQDCRNKRIIEKYKINNQIVNICKDCGEVFECVPTVKRKPTRCPACAKKHATESSKERMRAYRERLKNKLQQTKVS